MGQSCAFLWGRSAPDAHLFWWNYAHARNTAKDGGGRRPVNPEHTGPGTSGRAPDRVEVGVPDRLASVDAWKQKVVELGYFGGMRWKKSRSRRRAPYRQ